MPTAELARRALPDARVELNALGKLTTMISATADIGLRTAAATVVAGSVAPVALLSSKFEEQGEMLQWYADAVSRSVDENFEAPDGAPDVRVHRVNRPPIGVTGAQVELIRYPSRFTGLHPDRKGVVHGPNGTAWAQHWRHEGAPRPTLIVSHGFMGSGYAFNSAFFSLPWFFRHGYDVVLVTLPHHGRRREKGSPYSGHGLFADGLAGMAESMTQAVHDIRSLVEHLLHVGAPTVGMTGLSLGGYTTAIMAAAEERLTVAVPNSAVVDLPGIMPSWQPAGALLKFGLRKNGVTWAEFKSAFAVHSALNYPSKVDKKGLFVIGGLGDRLAPPEQSRALWEHWERPRLHWFPGNHVLHVNRTHYQQRMMAHFHENGFRP